MLIAYQPGASKNLPRRFLLILEGELFAKTGLPSAGELERPRFRSRLYVPKVGPEVAREFLYPAVSFGERTFCVWTLLRL